VDQYTYEPTGKQVISNGSVWNPYQWHQAQWDSATQTYNPLQGLGPYDPTLAGMYNCSGSQGVALGGSGCNYQGPGTGASAWTQIGGLESQGLSYAGAICVMTAYPGCDVSFAVGDPIECYLSTHAIDSHHYLVGRAKLFCEGGAASKVIITLWVYHCQPVLWGCIWWEWHEGPTCPFSNVAPGQTVTCPGSANYNYGPIGAGSGGWSLGATATVYDMNGGFGSGGLWGSGLDF
jgi:hypothetical protein